MARRFRREDREIPRAHPQPGFLGDGRSARRRRKCPSRFDRSSAAASGLTWVGFALAFVATALAHTGFDALFFAGRDQIGLAVVVSAFALSFPAALWASRSKPMP